MEDLQSRLAEQDRAIHRHDSAIGRLQGQFGIIIGLQLAQVTGLIAILFKVFGGV